MTGLDVTYVGALTAGLLSFLSPCVLPIVPPYLAFIGGVSLDEMGAATARTTGSGGLALAGAGAAGGMGTVATVSMPATAAVRAARRRTALAAVAFVLGFGTIFVMLGAGAAMAGNVVSRHADVLAPVAGVLIIGLGLHFMGVFRVMGLYRDLRLQVAGKPAGLAGAYLVGLAFGFGWTPCVGPVLAAILFVAGTSASPVEGAALLGAYAAGIGIPFVIAALLLGTFVRFAARFKRHMGAVEKVIGGFLVITGVVFITGATADIANWLLKAVPAFRAVG